MSKYQLLLIAFLIVPLGLYGQSQEHDDPFERDPIFNKSLDELFGRTDSTQEENEQSHGKERENRSAVEKLSRTGVDLGGSIEAGPYYSSDLYSLYPNLPTIHFNRVNGLFIGYRKERMQWHRYSSFLDIPQIQPHGLIGWGTASKDWEYALGLEKIIGEDRRFLIGGEFHNATATEDYKRVGLVESSLTSFFAAYDYPDYYNMEGFGFYGIYRTQRWIETGFSYTRDQFSTLEQNTNFSLFGKSGTYSPNRPIDANADEIDLDIYGLSLSLNPRNILIANKFTMAASIKAEFADNSASDEGYRFNKYLSEFRLYYNFEPGSVFRWRVQAGGITGNAPDFKDFYLGGIGTLRGSPYKVFQGNQMVLSNLEVQFGSPSGHSGEWIEDYNLHILLFLDSGWTQQTPDLLDSNTPFTGFDSFSISNMQHDAGFGIGSGAFRLEMGWPLKTFDKSPTLWIRFNPTF